VEKLLSLLMTFNSRTNEFAADRYAVSLHMGKELASGLIKISVGEAMHHLALRVSCPSLLFSMSYNIDCSSPCFTENLSNMIPDRLYSMYHYRYVSSPLIMSTYTPLMMSPP